MNLDQIETGDHHQEVWALLPWYIMGNLDADEHEMVERHISFCSLCQKEVAEQRRLASSISDEGGYDLDDAEEQGWQNISAMVDAENQQSVSNVVDIMTQQRKPRISSQWMTSGLIAASLLAVVLIVPSVIKQEELYETLTDNAVVSGEFLRIKAEDGVENISMLALFDAHDLEVLNGPSPTGVYTVRSKTGQSLTSTFKKMSVSPKVAFVSQLQGSQ